MSTSTPTPTPSAPTPTPAMTFEDALALIQRGHEAQEKALTFVFRACLKDLFHSKSVDRLNMAARALSALPVWNEFCKRVRLAYGGSAFSPDGSKVFDNNELSCIHYVKKFNGFIRQDMPDTSYQAHLQFFDAKLSNIPWNAYKYSKQEKKALITDKEIKMLYARIRDNKASWSAEHRATLEKVLSALAGILD